MQGVTNPQLEVSVVDKKGIFARSPLMGRAVVDIDITPGLAIYTIFPVTLLYLKIIDLPGGEINDPSPGEDIVFICSFQQLPPISLRPSQCQLKKPSKTLNLALYVAQARTSSGVPKKALRLQDTIKSNRRKTTPLFYNDP